jgi:hypothetical protein
VVSIHELSGDEETSSFENTSPSVANELELLFQQDGSEREIESLYQETDRWLDLRNWATRTAPEKLSAIDCRLALLSKRLFELEI